MPSQQLINIIIKATDEASATAQKVDQNLRKIGNTSSMLSKIPGFDSMKSKLSGLATTIDGKLGGALTKARNSFNSIKSTVTSVGTAIKGKFTGAVDGVRAKLSSLSNGSSGLASSMNFLKGAASMTAGMIGFELVSGFVEAGRAAINSASQVDYFGQRLEKMSGKSHLSSQQFQQFKSELGDLQKEFRKVDMTAVGATAEEIAVKMNLPANKLSDLTRMTAVLSSTFVKEGRTQEDAVLAVGDALDGQFRRLQEIGITQDTLKNNGWDGNLENQAGLIDALNKSMQKMGYEQTAKDITNLDEAFTALSIAGGQVLSSILIPITPALISVMEAIINATDAVKPFIDGLLSLAGALPDWIKDGAIFAAFGAAIIAVGMWINTTLIPAFAAATLAAIDFAIALMANPLTWVVVALVAIAFAIYEVGKAFGWWTDVQGMLAAICDGVRRLWEAFINNPNVQGFLSALAAAWDWVSQAIGGVLSWAGQLWEQLFPPDAEGNVDIVHMIIEAFTWLSNVISTIIGFVGMLWNGFNQLASGQITLLGIASMVWNGFISIVTIALGGILNAVTSYLSQLPGRVWTWLVQTTTRIVTQTKVWVTKAKAAARQLVTGVISLFMTLPGRVFSALFGVVSRITGAIQSWINAARSKVQGVISAITSPFTGVAGKISSALSGVANAITNPFRDAWNMVKPWVDKIKQGIDLIGNLSFGGEAAYGGETLDSNGRGFNISTGAYVVNTSDSPIVIEDNINLNLDLSNVPSHIDTNTLINALTDKNVLTALTSNRDFQNLDSKVKQRINLKQNRARGA